MRTVAACLFILSIFLLSFSSCKKGCTNPHAQNYNPSAKEDDASCRSCDSSVLNSAIQNNYQYDYTSGSPYYSQGVVNAVMNAAVYSYSGNACPKSTLLNSCSNGSFFQGLEYADLTLTNLTQRTMLFSFQVQLFNQNNSTFFDTTITNLQIAPYGSVTPIRQAFLGCSQSSFISTSMSFNSTTFAYQ